MEKRILYVCDMKKNCCNSLTCGRNWSNGCFHTTDIKHARNFENFCYSDDIGETVSVYSELPAGIPENIRNVYRDLKETYEKQKETYEKQKENANAKGAEE